MKKLSIIIPAYNEEKRIGKTLEEYSKFFNKLRDKKILDYNLLVSINNTKDKTLEVVESFQDSKNKISYLNLKKGGKGYAITEGFKISLKRGFDLIGFVDADLATSPQEFFKLVQATDLFDGAIADRYLPESKIYPAFSFRRKVVSRVFNFIVRSTFFLPYGDTQCGAKVFKREVIKEIVKDFTITQWAFDIDLLYSCKKHNYQIKSVPTIWFEKEGSKLKIVKTSIQMFFSVVQLRISKSPFRKFIKILKPLVGIFYKLIK